MKTTTNHWFLLLAVIILTFVTAAVTLAQGGSINIPAEGEINRGPGQHGVNRRVAIGQPEDARVKGYFGMSATFRTALQIPTGSALNTLRPGRLPNKPSFYFGLKGVGWHWLPDDPTFQRKLPGQWVNQPNLEIDAGLEYDSRPAYRGWRALISVNRVQIEFRTASGPWRGQASEYDLTFRIDNQGVPYLRVRPSGGTAFEFAWNHTGVLGTPEEKILIPNSHNVVGMKRVIANTRPAPPANRPEINYRLDGLRFTCTTTECKLYYYWEGNLGIETF